MPYLLDILFLAIFVITVIVSAKKGFFASLFDLAATVAALIFAKLFSQSLAPVIFTNSFDAPIRARLSESLGGIASVDYAGQIDAAVRALPEPVAGIMELIGVNREDLLLRLSQSPGAGKTVLDELMQSVVSPVMVSIIRTVLFAVIAVTFTVALRFVCRALNAVIKKLPAIRQVNAGLGFVLGFLRGALVVFICALLLDVVAGFIGNQTLMDLVAGSVVEKSVSGFLASISGYIHA